MKKLNTALRFLPLKCLRKPLRHGDSNSQNSPHKQPKSTSSNSKLHKVQKNDSIHPKYWRWGEMKEGTLPWGSLVYGCLILPVAHFTSPWIVLQYTHRPSSIKATACNLFSLTSSPWLRWKIEIRYPHDHFRTTHTTQHPCTINTCSHRVHHYPIPLNPKPPQIPSPDPCLLSK